MNQLKLILTTFFIVYCVVASCQISEAKTMADRFKTELSDYLSEKAFYPQDAFTNHTWGDVILSCELDSNGRFLEPSIVKSPDLQLTSGSVITLRNLDKFLETKKPDLPTGRNYLFIFRYRIYTNAMPVDNKARAMKLYNVSNWEKAIKIFSKAINENEYDHELYRLRAKCKENLGDALGAKEDHAIADNLTSEVMAVIDVMKLQAQSYNGVRLTGSRIVAVPVSGP